MLYMIFTEFIFTICSLYHHIFKRCLLIPSPSAAAVGAPLLDLCGCRQPPQVKYLEILHNVTKKVVLQRGRK